MTDRTFKIRLNRIDQEIVRQLIIDCDGAPNIIDVSWTDMLFHDLKEYHGIDAVRELTEMLVREVDGDYLLSNNERANVKHQIADLVANESTTS